MHTDGKGSIANYGKEWSRVWSGLVGRISISGPGLSGENLCDS
jgi:hypothetical protein